MVNNTKPRKLHISLVKKCTPENVLDVYRHVLAKMCMKNVFSKYFKNTVPEEDYNNGSGVNDVSREQVLAAYNDWSSKISRFDSKK